MTRRLWTHTSPSGCHSGSCSHPDQRGQTGEEPFDDTQLQRQLEADRGARRLQKQLLELAPDALGREVIERHGLADRLGSLVYPPLESGGELDSAQHPKAVVSKSLGVHHPEDAAFQILDPAMWDPRAPR